MFMKDDSSFHAFGQPLGSGLYLLSVNGEGVAFDLLAWLGHWSPETSRAYFIKICDS